MEIKVKVITNAKKNKIVKVDDYLKVYLTSQPVKGKANKELIKVLANYLSTRKSNVTIIKGEKSHQKIVKVNKLFNPRTDNVLKPTKIPYKDKKKNYISKVHCWER